MSGAGLLEALVAGFVGGFGGSRVGGWWTERGQVRRLERRVARLAQEYADVPMPGDGDR